MGCEIKDIGTTELANIPYVGFNMYHCSNELPSKDVPKISILKKAFLGSSCSALVIKKFKKIPVEEFHFSEIIVLYPATLPDNELFHSHFFKVFNHNCRMVYYNGTVTLC